MIQNLVYYYLKLFFFLKRYLKHVMVIYYLSHDLKCSLKANICLWDKICYVTRKSIITLVTQNYLVVWHLYLRICFLHIKFASPLKFQTILKGGHHDINFPYSFERRLVTKNLIINQKFCHVIDNCCVSQIFLVIQNVPLTHNQPRD